MTNAVDDVITREYGRVNCAHVLVAHSKFSTSRSKAKCARNEFHPASFSSIVKKKTDKNVFGKKIKTKH